MLFWVILFVFALPLAQYLLQIISEKKETDIKLKKIQKRLKQLEEKNSEK
jgi:K+-transporting ATPase A subunit